MSTISTPYSDFDDKVSGTVNDAAAEGFSFVKDNFPAAMLVTGGFVLWRIGKRVIRSVA